MRSFYITVLTLFGHVLAAQQTPTHVTVGTTTIGVSAISVNTIIAKTYQLAFPIYQYGVDSASGLFFFSGRQKTDAGNQYAGRSFVAAIDMDRDSVVWQFESASYELQLCGNHLFFSNESRSTRYNKPHGFEDFKFPAKLLYMLPEANKGFLYKEPGSDVLSCVNLLDGSEYWNARIPSRENWVDVTRSGDSLLLIAAGGLHGIYPGNGLAWTYPLTTAQRVTKPLTYSLANNNPSIRKIGSLVKTSNDENNVTELSSNILVENGTAYFAASDKLIAVSTEGKLLWELDMKAFPVSKMLLYKKGPALVLVNFGLARYEDKYVIYGSPFVLSIDADHGTVKNRSGLKGIENLVDFVITDKSLMFAGKNAVLEVKEGADTAETILTVDAGQYGNFDAFIQGSQYYAEKESFYVSLNFINDNLVYFRADNNKIYGFDKSGLTYEYHLSDIYHLEKKFDNKLLIANENKSLLVSSNFDLLSTFNTTGKPVVKGNRLYFVEEQQIQSVDLNALK